MVRTLQTLKCNKKEEIVNTPQPSGTEAQLLKAEFQQELKSLSERKRRTFLRYLKNQEKSKISFSFYLFSLSHTFSSQNFRSLSFSGIKVTKNQ